MKKPMIIVCNKAIRPIEFTLIQQVTDDPFGEQHVFVQPQSESILECRLRGNVHHRYSFTTFTQSYRPSGRVMLDFEDAQLIEVFHSSYHEFEEEKKIYDILKSVEDMVKDE